MPCYQSRPSLSSRSMNSPRGMRHKLFMILALVSLVGFSLSMRAQNNSPLLDPVVQHNVGDWVLQGRGVPDDWTHHRLVFSNPGTMEEAVKNGTFEHWLKVTNDPRFILHQVKRSQSAGAPTGELASAASTPSNGSLAAPSKPKGGTQETLKRDWSVTIGHSGNAGVYPAKFGFAATTASCSDFVVFPVNAGASGTATVDASIVAENNLYKTGCSGTNPTQFWAANLTYKPFTTTHYSTVTTSPVLSVDGSEVAFVATIDGVAFLVVLLMPDTNSSTTTSISCPATTNVNNTSQTASPQAWCQELQNTTGVTDTYSSPFYDYSGNVLYVGDDNGVLHQFQHVFHNYGYNAGNANTTVPGELTTTPWPVTVSSGYLLTSPVYDYGGSGLIFVADSHGLVESVNASSGALVKTTKVFGAAGIRDAPIVDSSTEKVYIFASEDEVSTGCTTTPYCTSVYQLPYNFTTSSTGTAEHVGTGSGTVAVYDGTFDNIYYNGTGITGNIYVCGNTSGDPILYQIAMNSTFTGTVTPVKTLTSAAATCSPVTEIYSSSVDWIFFSVTASGNLTGAVTNNCSGPCVYSYNVTGTPSYGNGITATGGASGIIIDNNVSSPAGSSQIYYEMLGASTAVQVSQSALQ